MNTKIFIKLYYSTKNTNESSEKKLKKSYDNIIFDDTKFFKLKKFFYLIEWSVVHVRNHKGRTCTANSFKRKYMFHFKTRIY